VTSSQSREHTWNRSAETACVRACVDTGLLVRRPPICRYLVSVTDFLNCPFQHSCVFEECKTADELWFETLQLDSVRLV
jgi:hypothetical protein